MIDRDWARARAHGLRDAQNIIVGTALKHLRWWRGIPLIGLRQARMVRKMQSVGHYILSQINELASECENEVKKGS